MQPTSTASTDVKKLLLAATVAIAVIPSHVVAGPAADALSACMLQMSTREDRLAIFRMVIAKAASTEHLRDLVTVAGAGLSRAEKAYEASMNRLLYKECANEKDAVIRREGLDGIEAAFRPIGGAVFREFGDW